MTDVVEVFISFVVLVKEGSERVGIDLVWYRLVSRLEISCLYVVNSCFKCLNILYRVDVV